MARTARLKRLLEILFLVRSTPGLRARDLAARFQISEKRIFDDLRYLNENGISIVFAENGYRLQSSLFDSASLFEMEEALLLLTALIQISKTTDVDETTIVRLSERILPPSQRTLIRDVHRLCRRSSETESASTVVQIRILTELQSAIISHRLIRILYRPCKAEKPYWRTVHPYRIFTRHDAWHLIAFCTEREANQVFTATRIEDITSLEETFMPLDEETIDDCLKHHWDIASGKPFIVLVAFDKAVTDSVLEKVSKKAKVWIDEERLYVQDIVRNLAEFKRWLLRYEASAEVIQPKILRTMMLETAEALQDLYRESSNNIPK